MTGPLKIMDEIDALYRRGYADARRERDYDPRGTEEWQSLREAIVQMQDEHRTAIEAERKSYQAKIDEQAEHIRILDTIIDDKETECREQFIKLEAQAERIARLKRQNESLAQEVIDKSDELAQKEARIARLHEQLQEYHDNAHYDDDENLYIGCCITEAQYRHCGKLLNESPAQSAAHLKAEALREAAERMGKLAPTTTKTEQDWLRLEADRIECEAKEES